MLGWSPEEFWRSTTDELLAAIDGWKMAHGTREEPIRSLTPAELKELMERFPDERA